MTILSFRLRHFAYLEDRTGQNYFGATTTHGGTQQIVLPLFLAGALRVPLAPRRCGDPLSLRGVLASTLAMYTAISELSERHDGACLLLFLLFALGVAILEWGIFAVNKDRQP
jgi:hypothetical protein